MPLISIGHVYKYNSAIKKCYSMYDYFLSLIYYILPYKLSHIIQKLIQVDLKNSQKNNQHLHHYHHNIPINCKIEDNIKIEDKDIKFEAEA